MFGLPISAGMPAGGLPGFQGSSSAESTSGAITAGGLNFGMRDSTDTLIMGLVVVAAAFVLVAYMKMR